MITPSQKRVFPESFQLARAAGASSIYTLAGASKLTFRPHRHKKNRQLGIGPAGGLVDDWILLRRGVAEASRAGR